MHPHIYRTRDSGKTWTEIVRGIPAGQTVNVVREDTQRKGLLFAGTERGVYVSFDDGDNWEPLRFNLPATSVRDLIVKDDDLAIGTHGRGFWVLDNITPLRQLGQGRHATALFKPQMAWRVRWNLNTDTPLPPDEPVGDNPPEGAMIDYSLATDANGPVVLEIKDAAGQLVRRHSSDDKPREPDPKTLKVPPYWVRPPLQLSAQAGFHRFVWDMRYPPLPDVDPEFPIAAIYRNTAPSPTAPLALPGDYTVTLSISGKSFSQPLKLKMDPRIKLSAADLQRQFELSRELYEARAKLGAIGKQFDAVTEQLKKLKEQTLAPALAAKVDGFAARRKELGAPNARPGAPPTLHVLDSVTSLFDEIQGVDAAPTTATRAAVADLLPKAAAFPATWAAIVGGDLAQLNRDLDAAGLQAIDLSAE
jgi:hypothetical protein